MNCKNCGAPLVAGDMFCKNCGAKVEVVDSTNSNFESNVQVDKNQVGFENTNNGPIYGNNNMGGFNPNLQGNNMNNNSNYNPNMQGTPKRNNTGVIIGIIIAVVLFLAATIIGTVVLVKVLKNNSSSGTIPSGISTTTGTTDTNEIAGSKIKVGNFTYTIPYDMVAKQQASDVLQITNSKSAWGAVLKSEISNFEKIKLNRNSLKDFGGYKINNVKLQTLNGIEFVTAECQLGGVKAVLGIAKLNSTYCIAAVVMDLKNDGYNYELLEKIVPIIKSAKYEASSSGMVEDTNINFDAIIKELSK